MHSFIHDDQKYASRYKKVKRYIQYHSNCELVSEREFIEKRGVPIQKRERAIRANCLGILIYVYVRECENEKRKKALEEILWNSIHSFLDCVTGKVRNWP